MWNFKSAHIVFLIANIKTNIALEYWFYLVLIRRIVIFLIWSYLRAFESCYSWVAGQTLTKQRTDTMNFMKQTVKHANSSTAIKRIWNLTMFKDTAKSVSVYPWFYVLNVLKHIIKKAMQLDRNLSTTFSFKPRLSWFPALSLQTENITKLLSDSIQS